jgi:hypothetical protein
MKRAWLLVALAGCIEPEKPESAAKTLEEIDAELERRRGAVKDLVVNAGMSVEGLENSGSLTVAIVYQPPGRLRMDGWKMSGPNLFTFLLKGDAFVIRKVAEDVWVRGKAGSGSRKHREMVAAFAWLEERLEAGESRAVEEDAADHVTIVTKRGERVVRRTRLDRPTLFASAITLYGDDGAEAARVAMTDYREVKPPEARPGPSVWVPWKVSIEGRKEDGGAYRIETKASRAYLNEGVEPGTFDVEIPAGAKVEEAE